MQGRKERNTPLASMILAGALHLVSGRLARTMVTLVGLAILSRLLNPADFGIVAMAVTLLPLATVLMHGLIEVPILRRDQVDDDEFSESILLGYVMMISLLLLIWWLSPIIALKLEVPELKNALRLLSIGLLLQPGCSAGEAILRRQRRFGVLAVFMPLTGLVYSVSAILMVLAGMGFTSLVYAHLLSLATKTVGVVWLSGVSLFPSLKLDYRLLRGNGGLGVLSGVLNWAAHNIDTFFVGFLLGASGAGIYSRAYNITTQLKDPFTSLNFTIREAFVSHRQVGHDRANRATMLGLRLIFFVSAMIAAIVIVMRDEVVLILLGNQWTDVTLPLAILLAALPFKVTRAYLNNFSQVTGSLEYLVIRNFMLCVLMLTGLWLSSDYGLLGIAISVSLIHTISCLFFPGGGLDVKVAGALPARAFAMLPGFVCAVLLIVLGELAGTVFKDTQGIASASLRCLICMLFSILIAIAFPQNWLPRPISDARYRITKLGR